MLTTNDFGALRDELYNAFEYNFIRIWADKIIMDGDKPAWKNFNLWATKRYGAIMSRDYTSQKIDSVINSILTEGTREQKDAIFDLIIGVHSEMIRNIDGVYIATDGEVFFPPEKEKIH
ncbi:MAG: hypothetical protein ACOX8W_05195 [bacterium]|jgi:hypothetical protein